MENKKVLLELKNLNSMIIRKNFANGKEKNLHPGGHSQKLIIGYLNENKDKVVYQRDLEKILDVRRSTLSGILRTMEKNDLIVRIDSENDARLKEVKLTNKSYEILKRKKEMFEKLETDIVKNISDEELKIFLNVLQRMKENLK